eukprot:578358-Amphidinium_carterae.1
MCSCSSLVIGGAAAATCKGGLAAAAGDLAADWEEGCAAKVCVSALTSCGHPPGGHSGGGFLGVLFWPLLEVAPLATSLHALVHPGALATFAAGGGPAGALCTSLCGGGALTLCPLAGAAACCGSSAAAAEELGCVAFPVFLGPHTSAKRGGFAGSITLSAGVPGLSALPSAWETEA